MKRAGLSGLVGLRLSQCGVLFQQMLHRDLVWPREDNFLLTQHREALCHAPMVQDRGVEPVGETSVFELESEHEIGRHAVGEIGQGFLLAPKPCSVELDDLGDDPCQRTGSVADRLVYEHPIRIVWQDEALPRSLPAGVNPEVCVLIHE